MRSITDLRAERVALKDRLDRFVHMQPNATVTHTQEVERLERLIMWNRLELDRAIGYRKRQLRKEKFGLVA